MMKNRCFIVGAGEFAKKCFAPEENDYMIAADGGYAYLKQMGIKPNLVVGDFDSLGYEPEHENVVRHPVMKDDTDLALACEMAMEKDMRRYIFMVQPAVALIIRWLQFSCLPD